MKTKILCRHDNKLEDGKCPICLEPREPQHTPTPWKVSLIKGHDFYPLIGADGKTVASIIQPTNKSQPVNEGDANAAFIVKCVNSHEELLQNLKNAEAVLLATSNGETLLMQEISNAIAKAEGK